MGVGLRRLAGVTGLAIGVCNMTPSSAVSPAPTSWNANSDGPLRSGAATPDIAEKVAPVGVTAISSGFEYSLALLSNSTVVA
jgi:hypothetical protein